MTQYAYGIKPEKELNIGYNNWPEIKSYIRIGNVTIYSTHHFNWFQRKMWKLFFGFEIENVKENDK